MNILNDVKPLLNERAVCEIKDGKIETSIGTFYPLIMETMQISNDKYAAKKKRQLEEEVEKKSRWFASKRMIRMMTAYGNLRFYDGHLDGSSFYYKIDGFSPETRKNILRKGNMRSSHSGSSYTHVVYKNSDNNMFTDPNYYHVRPDIIRFAKNLPSKKEHMTEMDLRILDELKSAIPILRLYRKISGPDVRDPKLKHLSSSLKDWLYWIREIDYSFKLINII